MNGTKRMAVCGIVLLFACGFGCSSQTPQNPPQDYQPQDYAPHDPIEGFNRGSYAVTDWVDRKALVPIARGYTKVTPSWWRTGVSNMFANLRSIDSSVNSLLQGKPNKAATDLARTMINTTVGVGGFFDVARRSDLQPGEEDLGQTLAVWGMKNTPYVFIPFLGPSSLRALPAVAIDSYLPRAVLGDDYELWMVGVNLLNSRAEALSLTDARDISALDPYAFTREAYYQRQKFLIFDGDPPVSDFFGDEFDDEFEDELDEEFDAEETQDDAATDGG